MIVNSKRYFLHTFRCGGAIIDRHTYNCDKTYYAKCKTYWEDNGDRHKWQIRYDRRTVHQFTGTVDEVVDKLVELNKNVLFIPCAEKGLVYMCSVNKKEIDSIKYKGKWEMN